MATVVQLDWGAATAICVPLGAGFAAVGRFFWAALFKYLSERDAVALATAERVAEELKNTAADVADKLKSVADHVATVKAAVDEADKQNRIDARATSERLISALVRSTAATEKMTNVAEVVVKKQDAGH